VNNTYIRVCYNLRDDKDIKARIAAANASMGALKEIWNNPHLDTYNKYLLFRAIPMNLLFWGCETWSLPQSLLDKLRRSLPTQKHSSHTENIHVSGHKREVKK
jgi:hypothetical protein